MTYSSLTFYTRANDWRQLFLPPVASSEYVTQISRLLIDANHLRLGRRTVNFLTERTGMQRPRTFRTKTWTLPRQGRAAIEGHGQHGIGLLVEDALPIWSDAVS